MQNFTQYRPVPSPRRRQHDYSASLLLLMGSFAAGFMLGLFVRLVAA